MDIFIVTGASKGIGFELSKQLREAGKKVIGIARTSPEDTLDFVSADLSKTDQLDSLIANLIDENYKNASSFTLINNAGIVDPIGIVGTVDVNMMVKALAVNLTAPLIMINQFILKLEKFEGVKRVVNISSGAGRSAYEGWGTYCATKAGLDQFSRVVALEQANATNPVEIVSIAPGIIDTGMQEVIRSSNGDTFPLLEQFISYKEQGHLSSAEETAQKLIAFMNEQDFNEVGPIADIRDF